MHPLLTEKIIENVRRRIAQGDNPSQPPHSVETLEDALDSCAAERDVARKASFGELASALKKFAPDLANELVARWQKANDEHDKTTLDFLSFLANHP